MEFYIGEFDWDEANERLSGIAIGSPLRRWKSVSPIARRSPANPVPQTGTISLVALIVDAISSWSFSIRAWGSFVPSVLGI